MILEFLVNLAASAAFDFYVRRIRPPEGEPDPLEVAVREASQYHPEPRKAAEALREWAKSDGFHALLEEIKADPKAMTSNRLVQAFDDAADFHNPVAGTAHVGTLVLRFFEAWNRAALQSKDGLVLLDRRIQERFDWLTDAQEAMEERIKRAIMGPPVFLPLAEFHRLLLRRDPEGYGVPFVREGWFEGQTPLQGQLKALVGDREAQVLLVTAPGGYGKSRTALELGLWAQGELGLGVAVTLSEGRAEEYLRHLEELEGVRLLIVDNAERAELRSLMDALARGSRHDLKLVVFARTAARERLLRQLATFPTARPVAEQLPGMTYEEAQLLLSHLGVTDGDAQERLYRESEAVPFFLLLLWRYARSGGNIHRFAAKEYALDSYIDEQLEAVGEESSCPRDRVVRVLSRLALLRRGHEGDGEPGLDALAKLAGAQPAEVAHVLGQAERVGAVVRRGGYYRFGYDLVAERVVVRFITPAEALAQLKALSFVWDGGVYKEVLESALLMEFQREERFLEGYLARLSAGIPALAAPDHRFLVENVIEPLAHFRAETAFGFALELAPNLSPEHPRLVDRLLEVVTGLAGFGPVRGQALELVATLTRLGLDPLSQEKARETVRRAASPLAESAEPFSGLPQAVETLASWVVGGELQLQPLALEGLAAALKLTFETLSPHPDRRRSNTFVVKRGAWNLGHPEFKPAYRRARKALMGLLGHGSHPLAGEAVRALAEALEGLCRYVDPSAEEPAASGVGEMDAWLEDLRGLLSELGALRAHAFRRWLVWVARHLPALEAKARELLGLLDSQPDAVPVKVFVHPPRAYDYDLELNLEPDVAADHDHWERRNQRAAEAFREQVRQLVAGFSPEDVVAFLEQADEWEPVVELCQALGAVLEAEPSYGLELFHRLSQHPRFTTRSLQCLPYLHRHFPREAESVQQAFLKEGSEEALLAMTGFLLSRPSKEKGGTAAELAGHPSPRVRAQVLKELWRVSPEEATPLILCALSVAPVDAQVASAAIEALAEVDRHQGSLGVPPEVAGQVLEATLDLPLRALDPHGGKIGQLTRRLAVEDPLWLLEHLERRAVHPGRDLGYDFFPYLGPVVLFPSPIESADLLMATVKRLEGWLAPEAPYALKSAAPQLLAVFYGHNPPTVTEYLERAVANAQDAQSLERVLSLVRSLEPTLALEPATAVDGGTVAGGETADLLHRLVEEALVKAVKLGLSPADQESIRLRAHSIYFQTRSKIGKGPFPQDVRVKQLAAQRLTAAKARVLEGGGDWIIVQRLWEGVLESAARNIEREMRLDEGAVDY